MKDQADIVKNAEILLKLNTPLDFDKAPTFKGTGKGAGVLAAENVGNGVPHMTYKLVTFLDDTEDKKDEVVTSLTVSCTNMCRFALQWDTKIAKGKLTFKVVGSNPAGTSTSAASKAIDIAGNYDVFGNQQFTSFGVVSPAQGCKNPEYAAYSGNQPLGECIENRLPLLTRQHLATSRGP